MAWLKDKSSNPVKASMWYTICSVVQKGIGMLLIPLYVRMMTTEEYGTYTLFQSWEGIVMVFTTLNLASYAFNNCLVQYEVQKDRVTGVFLGLICTLTAFASGVFIAFLGTWERVFNFPGKYILVMVLDSMFIVAIDLWFARQRFDYKYRGVVAVTLIISIANLIAGACLVSLSPEKAFTAVAVKAAIQGLVMLCISIQVWSKSKCFFDLRLWKYALWFNIPLIPHFLSTRILQQADRVMIQRYCGTTQAGIYGFSYKISDVMLIFNSALLASLIPWTYRKLKEEKFQEIFHRTYLTVILIGGLNLALILLAPEAIAILGTTEYRKAVYIIPPISCSCFLMYLFNVFVNVTYYYEKNKLVVMASIGAALLNVGLNWIFIPMFGFLAAGYTTLASYIFLVIMHGLMYRFTLHKEGISVKIYHIPQIIGITAVVLVLGLGCSLLYQGFIVRYVMIAGMGTFVFIKRKELIKLVLRK